MGLTFTVGNPSDALMEPFAERVRVTLLRRFGGAVDFGPGDDPYSGEELGWSGWQQLQQRAARAVGAERVPHLLSMDAWCGCYVPVETGPESFEFEGEHAPLKVASLPRLVSELEAVGTSLGLPTDGTGLHDLAGALPGGRHG